MRGRERGGIGEEVRRGGMMGRDILVSMIEQVPLGIIRRDPLEVTTGRDPLIIRVGRDLLGVMTGQHQMGVGRGLQVGQAPSRGRTPLRLVWSDSISKLGREDSKYIGKNELCTVLQFLGRWGPIKTSYPLTPAMLLSQPNPVRSMKTLL